MMLRSATSVKTPPQVVVGCGYLTNVIISLSQEAALPVKVWYQCKSDRRAVETKLLKLVPILWRLGAILGEWWNTKREEVERRIERWLDYSSQTRCNYLCVQIAILVRTLQSVMRVQTHREVKLYSSPVVKRNTENTLCHLVTVKTSERVTAFKNEKLLR